MKVPLEDLLADWCFINVPCISEHEFAMLLNLIRALLREAAREERERTARRILCPSRS